MVEWAVPLTKQWDEGIEGSSSMCLVLFWWDFIVDCLLMQQQRNWSNEREHPYIKADHKYKPKIKKWKFNNIRAQINAFTVRKHMVLNQGQKDRWTVGILFPPVVIVIVGPVERSLPRCPWWLCHLWVLLPASLLSTGAVFSLALCHQHCDLVNFYTTTLYDSKMVLDGWMIPGQSVKATEFIDKT